MSDERTVFCFGLNGYRDDYHSNYHPASLYRKGVDNPYAYHGEDEAQEMIGKAFDSLPKEPEEYEPSDAGRGRWVRFDYKELVSGENTQPIATTCEDDE